MIGIQNFAGLIDILIDPVCLFPRHAGHPVQIIPHHRSLGAHRAHIPQLFQLCLCFFARFFWHFCAINLLGDFINFIAPIFAIAQLFLNRLHLLVQIIFALGFFHLAFDTIADTLFHLQDANLAFHDAIDSFQTFFYILDFQQFLFFDDFHRQMRGDRICNFTGFLDLVYGNHHFRRNFLVQLDIMFKLLNGCFTKRDKLGFAALLIFQLYRLTCHIGAAFIKAGHICARHPFNKHLDRTIRQFQQLQDIADCPHGEHLFSTRILNRRICLGQQQYLFVF